MQLKTICSDDAPQAIGPYSQAVFVDGWLFVSGQVSIDPKTQKFCSFDGNVAEQTKQIFSNLGAILKSGELDFSNVVKMTVYMKDLKKFAVLNEEYAKYFQKHKPARATVEVSNLPLNADVEIDLIAKR